MARTDLSLKFSLKCLHTSELCQFTLRNRGQFALSEICTQSQKHEELRYKMGFRKLKLLFSAQDSDLFTWADFTGPTNPVFLWS